MLVEQRSHLGQVDLVLAAHPGPREVVEGIDEDEADGARHSGERRDDDLRHLQLERQVDGMQRPGPAEGEEAELARVEARARPSARAIALTMFAFAIRIMPSAASSTLSPSGSAMRTHRVAGQPGVELHSPAEQALVADAAEHEVSVGVRRLGAAFPVARRARVGAGALRSDLG